MLQFLYPPINPFRLIQQTSFSPLYQTVPFDFQEPLLQYSQKVQTDQSDKLQILSDFVPAMKIRDAHTNHVQATITLPTGLPIIGETYLLYEYVIDWNAIGVGNWYIAITYTDDTSTLQTWLSEVINCAVSQPNTLLFQYTNSVNAFSAIFSTGIIFNLRMEGIIADYEPGFEDVIYTDQYRNTTKLNGIPFRQFMLYLPGANYAKGLPNWICDKANWMLACDQIMIDGIYYQNTSGSKWEVKRTDPDGTNNIGLKVPIIEVNNLFLQSLKAGTKPPQGYTVVELADNHLNIGANFSVAGVYKKYTLIKNITVNNYDTNPITALGVGITPTGNELGVFAVPVPANFAFNRSIHLALLSAHTLYFTGLSAANCDILIDYLQYDANPVGPGTTPIAQTIPLCFVTDWEGINNTDFNRDWDLATGLGKASGLYYGYAICDGRNGTTDRGGTVSIGYLPDNTKPDWLPGYDVLGTIVGLPSIRQTLQQMAVHSHPIATTSSATSTLDLVDPVRGHVQGSRNQRGGSGTPGTTYGPGGDGINDAQTIGFAGGNGDNTGLGAPMENRQLSIVTLRIKKIM